jgi:hypothetical protein
MHLELPGILIVDDNEDNRYTLQLLLESDGHERVASASGGNEAIALLAAVICIYWMITTTAALCQDSGKPRKLNGEVEHCSRINDERERMRCKKEEDSRPSTNVSQQPAPEPGTWQLARTPNPAGGPVSISIMKSANINGSDQDIAGLMLRCGEGGTTEVLVVLIEPLPPRAHPKVTVVAGAMTTELIASVVSPGALVLLPEKASALVEDTWQSAPELAISISENRRSLHGVISLADISTAMQTLQSNCPTAVPGR